MQPKPQQESSWSETNKQLIKAKNRYHARFPKEDGPSIRMWERLEDHIAALENAVKIGVPI